MRTARSSSRGGLHQAPPQSRPPRSRPSREQAPPSSRHPPELAPPRTRHPRTRHPPVNRMTNRCKNITLPQTSFAGGNNVLTVKRGWRPNRVTVRERSYCTCAYTCLRKVQFTLEESRNVLSSLPMLKTNSKFNSLKMRLHFTALFTKPLASRFPNVPWFWLVQFLWNRNVSIGCQCEPLAGTASGGVFWPPVFLGTAGN